MLSPKNFVANIEVAGRESNVFVSLKTTKSNAKILINQLINLVVKQFDALHILNVLNLTEKQNVFASMDMNSMMLELVSVAMIGAKEDFQINMSCTKVEGMSSTLRMLVTDVGDQMCG